MSAITLARTATVARLVPPARCRMKPSPDGRGALSKDSNRCPA
jgi:hypothetical protein